MKIEPNKAVALTYDLYTTEAGEEVFVERADEENPLVFLFGTGMMLPKFEENLAGLAEGGTYDFKLSAADAYGEKDPEAAASLPLDMFDGKLPAVGEILHLQNNEGQQFRARVDSVDELAVNVDLNHPMAGKDLHFTGTIIKVREATADELAHGHAHGADGHGGH
jgi:FKBP-type peptidyl-prolyl cis-trans isomerase SlyD